VWKRLRPSARRDQPLDDQPRLRPLDEIVDGPGGKSRPANPFVCKRGVNYDAHVRTQLAQVLEDLLSVHRRHADVEQQDVGLLAGHGDQRL
jgi:hypothetical protein